MTNHSDGVDLTYLSWIVFEFRFVGQEQKHIVSLPTDSRLDVEFMARAMLSSGVIDNAIVQTLAHAMPDPYLGIEDIEGWPVSDPMHKMLFPAENTIRRMQIEGKDQPVD